MKAMTYLSPFSDMNTGRFPPKNLVWTFSGVYLSHVKNAAADCLGPPIGKCLEPSDERDSCRVFNLTSDNSVLYVYSSPRRCPEQLNGICILIYLWKNFRKMSRLQRMSESSSLWDLVPSGRLFHKSYDLRQAKLGLASEREREINQILLVNINSKYLDVANKFKSQKTSSRASGNISTSHTY